jgi:hypothetical protein
MPVVSQATINSIANKANTSGNNATGTWPITAEDAIEAQTALEVTDLFNANTVSHSDSTLVLTNPLANLQIINLTNADTVQLPAINGQVPAWKGRAITVVNNGNPDSSSPFQIVAQDGATVIVPRLEIGESADLYVTDDSTANGIFICTIYSNERIVRRIINGGNIGTDIPVYLINNVVIETDTTADFTASEGGTNGITEGINWIFKNNSANALLTFTPSADTIDGAASLTLNPGESAHILWNSVQFETIALSRMSPGGYLATSYSTTTALTNPVSLFNNITPGNNNQRLQLPAANVINSMKVGQPYIFQNMSSTNNAVLANQANGTLLTIRPMEIFILVLTSNSTANGSYDGYAIKSMASQSADDVTIEGGFIDNTEIGSATPANGNFLKVTTSRNSSSDTDYYTMQNLDNTLNAFNALAAQSYNTTPALKIFSDIVTTITDRTASSEDAAMALRAIVAGTLTTILSLNSSGAAVTGALSVTDAPTTRSNLGLNQTITDATTARVLSNSDDFADITMTNASANTVTINTGLRANFSCIVRQGGSGTNLTSLVAGGGVTFVPATKLKLLEQGSCVYIKQSTTANTFYLSGDLTV